MKRLHVAALALLTALFVCGHANAASVNGMTQVYVCDATINQGNNCYKPILTPLAGAQIGLSIAGATALTVPAGATIALIQAQGTNNTSGVCLYWRDDGTNPTASTGMQMPTGSPMFYEVGSLPIKLIAATGATCAATIFYYN